MARDKEKQRKYNRSYYLRNRRTLLPKIRQRVKAWQSANKERRNHIARERRAKGEMAYNAEHNRKSRLKLKTLVVQAYGGQCACCGESELELLTIDHVNGGGSKERASMTSGGGATYRWLRDRGFPKTFQVLCWNCNWSKHYGGGVCVHKRNN